MNKSNFFSGQPIFNQLIKPISKGSVFKIAREHKSDRYCKKMDTYVHLLSMLYCCFENCTSLREIVTGMQACMGRLQPLGITYSPARSTLSDANMRRSYVVFEHIYQYLYQRYRELLPDSLSGKNLKKLIIIDSTTISLFKEILKKRRSIKGKWKKERRC